MLMIRRVFGEENAVETTSRRPRRRCGCALGMMEQREVEVGCWMLVVRGWIEILRFKQKKAEIRRKTFHVICL